MRPSLGLVLFFFFFFLFCLFLSFLLVEASLNPLVGFIRWLIVQSTVSSETEGCEELLLGFLIFAKRLLVLLNCDFFSSPCWKATMVKRWCASPRK
jgi:hypothetical protein